MSNLFFIFSPYLLKKISPQSSSTNQLKRFKLKSRSMSNSQLRFSHSCKPQFKIKASFQITRRTLYLNQGNVAILLKFDIKRGHIKKVTG